MHALSLRPEQAEKLRRIRAGAAEPVRYPGVELGRLAGSQYQIVLAEHQPEPPAEDIQPLVALVGLRVGCLTGPAGWDHMFVGLEATGSPGEREHGHPVAGDRAWMDAGVASGRCPDELVERNLMRSGQWQQELKVRAALPGFQS